MRGDAQYCPVAMATEILGDRWTLLIARERDWGGCDRVGAGLARALETAAPVA